jgi:hypothetical protein
MKKKILIIAILIIFLMIGSATLPAMSSHVSNENNRPPNKPIVIGNPLIRCSGDSAEATFKVFFSDPDGDQLNYAYCNSDYKETELSDCFIFGWDGQVESGTVIEIETTWDYVPSEKGLDKSFERYIRVNVEDEHGSTETTIYDVELYRSLSKSYNLVGRGFLENLLLLKMLLLNSFSSYFLF